MKKLLSLVTLFSVAVASPSASYAASPVAGATVKSQCSVGATRAMNILLRDKIKSQYEAAGHKNVVAFVAIKTPRTTPQSITYQNIAGISAINVSADGSTVSLATGAAPVSLACAIELPVLIKVSYLPANSKGPRKSVNVTQKVTFQGSFK